MIVTGVKRAQSLFTRYIASVVPLCFSPKTLETNGVTCISFAKSSRAAEKWAIEDILKKFFIIFLVTSNLSKLKVDVSEATTRKQEKLKKILTSIFLC